LRLEFEFREPRSPDEPPEMTIKLDWRTNRLQRRWRPTLGRPLTGIGKERERHDTIDW